MGFIAIRETKWAKKSTKKKAAKAIVHKVDPISILSIRFDFSGLPPTGSDREMLQVSRRCRPSDQSAGTSATLDDHSARNFNRKPHFRLQRSARPKRVRKENDDDEDDDDDDDDEKNDDGDDNISE